MAPLAETYQLEVDSIAETNWYQLLEQFTDASLYQTWAYGKVRWGEDNLSHCVLKQGDNIVAAAQLRIMRLPVLPGGIAYLRWGGLWQSKNQPPNPEHFRQMSRALRDEYAKKRGLLLRILPNIRDDAAAQEQIDILAQENYQRKPLAEGGRTLYVDLSLSEEALRAALKPRWRNYLKRAEKLGFELIEGSSDELYEQFQAAYRQMHQRKQFVEYVDIEEYRDMQQALPPNFKMHVMLCRLDGEIQAAIICAAAGDMGIYALGATSDEGLKNRASYLLHWNMLLWLQQQGYRWYDLGGINPDKVPGTAQFKYGLAGKQGVDAYPIGQFDYCSQPLSCISVALADKLRMLYRKLKEMR
ncbi:GNAT family N-acetyltransferase [Candidatus Venteria ishoeyi]|uniref:lipid II:glycine glycyltransferase FemX n=1 Tax=Candidatus Venteria ishoeyi TaxID=1899563 RepID=UPI0025A5666F|nr:GNAT family N-acetyltransferase [Candidatus Venteria ishoeyi]MDM8546234.1 GNAT family N-acetyltransferase [Candidatus Venteria ishoeyi]